MSNPETTVDAVARALFLRYYIYRDDSREEWAMGFWDRCANAEHKGDCPHAEHKGPITCERCVCDEFRADAKAVMEVLSMIEPTSSTTGLAPTELVAIEGDDIVIRVPLDALVFATEHGCLCTFSKIKNDFRTVSVHDPVAWRGAIVRALRREEENGDTPVHLMLDGALEYAADQGEEGISIEGILP